MKIDKWFPTAIYCENDVCLNDISTYETTIKNILMQYGYGKGGMQNVSSTHQTYDTLHKLKEFTNLKTHILNRASEFAYELGYTDQSDNIQIKNMWANVSQKGDYLFPHTHSDSVISGAYYVKGHKDLKIKFLTPQNRMIKSPDKFSELSYEFCDYECYTGRLLLFKSNTNHATEKQLVDEKIVVSFNLDFSI